MIMDKIALHVLVYRKTPAHAQMHEEALACRELSLQEFRPAREARQCRPLYTLRKIRGEGKAQVRAVKLNPIKDKAFHNGGKPAADGFDLRELWHA